MISPDFSERPTSFVHPCDRNSHPDHDPGSHARHLHEGWTVTHGQEAARGREGAQGNHDSFSHATEGKQMRVRKSSSLVGHTTNTRLFKRTTKQDNLSSFFEDIYPSWIIFITSVEVFLALVLDSFLFGTRQEATKMMKKPAKLG